MALHGSARGPVLSLERKLPILIGGLVTIALVVTLLLVRYELRGSAIEAAEERLALVGAQLDSLFTRMVALRSRSYEAVAADPAVVAFATAQGNDVAALRRALDRLRQPSDGDLPIQLRSVTGRVIAATGETSGVPETPESTPPPRGDRVVYSRVIPSGDGYTYWASVPVVHAGTIVGHVTQQRSGGAGSNITAFEQLLGSSLELYLANSDGGDWTGLDGLPLKGAPRITRLERPFGYALPDGGEYYAYAEHIAGTPWLFVTQMPMAGVTARTDEVLKRIGLTGLVLLLFGLLAAWSISRRVTVPLSELGHVADAIAAGDYSRRTQFDRHDEIGRLAGSLDAMASRVEGAHAELQRRFHEARSLAGDLEVSNARLHAAIRDAELARRDAQQASTAKSEFLATMSHEIRTPINAIIGYADLMDLRLGGELTAEQQNYLERIRLSSEHLMSVVNDVLDFAKIESGQMRIAREVRSARSVIEDAVSMLQARADTRNIRVSVAGSDAVFLGDAQRVQQILLNLLSNALKFTPAGGAVWIECQQRESQKVEPYTDVDGLSAWTCITVRDTGVGIAGDQIGPIFEPFVQGTGGYTRPHGGTGLGLAISRSLARMMEGDLTVESELGVGSTFTLWLPHPSTSAVAAG